MPCLPDQETLFGLRKNYVIFLVRKMSSAWHERS
jgi:hypothetical protein